MANNIETQILSHLDRLQDLIIANGDLAQIAADLDVGNGRFHSFANMHNFVQTELDAKFAIFKQEIVEQILPLVRDLKGVKLG